MPQWLHSCPVNQPLVTVIRETAGVFIKAIGPLQCTGNSSVFMSPRTDIPLQSYCCCQGTFHNLFLFLQIIIKVCNQIKAGQSEFLESTRSIPWIREGNGTPLSTLAWKIPWMEEPGRLQSMGLLRVGLPFIPWIWFPLWNVLQFLNAWNLVSLEETWFSPSRVNLLVNDQFAHGQATYQTMMVPYIEITYGLPCVYPLEHDVQSWQNE